MILVKNQADWRNENCVQRQLVIILVEFCIIMNQLFYPLSMMLFDDQSLKIFLIQHVTNLSQINICSFKV